MKKPTDTHNNNFYKAILSLGSLDECRDFFDDICSMNEIYSMKQRYAVAEMLEDEKVYSEIIQETCASSATVSRVKKVLFYGTGRLYDAIRKVKEQESGFSQ